MNFSKKRRKNLDLNLILTLSNNHHRIHPPLRLYFSPPYVFFPIPHQVYLFCFKSNFFGFHFMVRDELKVKQKEF